MSKPERAGPVSKEDKADTVLITLGDKSSSGNITNLRLAVRKQRDGVAGMEFPYTPKTVELGLDEDDERITSVVIEFGDPATAATHPKEKELSSLSVRTLRRALMTMLADCGEEILPFADGPRVRAVKQKIVRAEFNKQYPTDEIDDDKKRDARKKAWKRAIANKAFTTREIDETEWIWLST